MNKQRSLGKVEIILCLLALISIPLYGLALFQGKTFAWICFCWMLVTIIWAVAFALPKTWKEIKRKKQG